MADKLKQNILLLSTLECGCKIYSYDSDRGQAADIIFCPTHAAAPALLEACEALVDAMGDVLDAHAWPNCPDCRQGLAALEDGQAAIAAARPVTEIIERSVK